MTVGLNHLGNDMAGSKSFNLWQGMGARSAKCLKIFERNPVLKYFSEKIISQIRSPLPWKVGNHKFEIWKTEQEDFKDFNPMGKLLHRIRRKSHQKSRSLGMVTTNYLVVITVNRSLLITLKRLVITGCVLPLWIN